MSVEQLDLLAQPAARAHDPVTSHLAAQSARGRSELTRRAIREYVRLYGPATAFDIADAVVEHMKRIGEPVQHDTVRSAVSRSADAGEIGVARMQGTSPGGKPCRMYVLHTKDLPAL